MTTTVNNEIPFVPEGTIDPAAGLNDALNHIDAILQVAVTAIQNAPPVSPAEGDRYLVGTGSGAWAGHDDEVAMYLNGQWAFHDSVKFLFNYDDELIYVNTGGSSGWVSILTASQSGQEKTFGIADVDSSGGVMLTHTVSRQYVNVTIYDENDKIVIPNEVDVSAGTGFVYLDLDGFDVADYWHAAIS